jgi:hypothetical protein
LADHYLSQGISGRPKVIEYLEQALEQYMVLEEMGEAMECILELKYCGLDVRLQNDLMEKVKQIAFLIRQGVYHPVSVQEKDLVQCMLYDFLNIETQDTRTDYVFEKNIEERVRKNIKDPRNLDSRFLRTNELFCQDGDTTPFRRSLTRFYHNRMCDLELSLLAENAGAVIDCAEKKPQTLTHSDFKSMQNILKYLMDKLKHEDPDQLDKVLQLEMRLNYLLAQYQKQVQAFVEEKLHLIASKETCLAVAD